MITVVGSINMDIVAFVNSYPQHGDTVFGDKLEFSPGGKGANQATACAKLGKEVTLIGCVGEDPFSDRLISTLQRNKVNVDNVKRSKSTRTGTVLVTVDESAANTMLVVQGANEQLNIGDIESC
jgi:ribokinase